MLKELLQKSCNSPGCLLVSGGLTGDDLWIHCLELLAVYAAFLMVEISEWKFSATLEQLGLPLCFMGDLSYSSLSTCLARSCPRCSVIPLTTGGKPADLCFSSELSCPLVHFWCRCFFCLFPLGVSLFLLLNQLILCMFWWMITLYNPDLTWGTQSSAGVRDPLPGHSPVLQLHKENKCQRDPQ